MTQELVNALSNARHHVECLVPQVLLTTNALNYTWVDGGAVMDAVEGHVRYLHAEPAADSLTAVLPGHGLFTVTKTGEVYR